MRDEEESKPTVDRIPDLDVVMGFRRTLTPESDRGCALIAGAFLDTQLEALLRASFVDDVRAYDDLFSGSQALATFSARIHVAYAVGLLPSEAYRDLHLIRRIRNDFAHNTDPITFEEPAIAARCRELTMSWYERTAPARSRFTSSVMGVLGVIHSVERSLVRPTIPLIKPLDKARLKAEFDQDFQELEDDLAKLIDASTDRQEFSIKALDLLQEHREKKRKAESGVASVGSTADQASNSDVGQEAESGVASVDSTADQASNSDAGQEEPV